MPTSGRAGYEGFDDLFVANGCWRRWRIARDDQGANREIVHMNTDGPSRQTLINASYEPGTMTPEDYGVMIDRELKLWGDVVQETGVRVKA